MLISQLLTIHLSAELCDLNPLSTKVLVRAKTFEPKTNNQGYTRLSSTFSNSLEKKIFFKRHIFKNK